MPGGLRYPRAGAGRPFRAAWPSLEALGTKGPPPGGPEEPFSRCLEPPWPPQGTLGPVVLCHPGLPSTAQIPPTPFLRHNWNLIKADRGLIVTPRPGSVSGAGFHGAEPLAGVRPQQKRSRRKLAAHEALENAFGVHSTGVCK